jgi:ketosteroid isomerase-like protein
MKRTIAAAVSWSCSGLALLLAVSMSSCSRSKANAEQELRTAMGQRRAAFEGGDAEGYAKLTADDLMIVDDDGAFRTKPSILEQIRKDGPELPPGEVSDLHVQINGDIGIMVYHVDKEERLGNQSIKSETRELETYKRQSGKWILISRALVPMPYPNRTPAKIDLAVYSKYVGVYDFGDNFQLTVKKDGEKLAIFDSVDKTPQGLLPFSDSNFYQDKSVGVFTFVRDKKDKVVKLEIWSHNSTVTGRKIS